MKNKRGFASPAILMAIVLGLILVGGGAYFVMQKNSSSQTASENNLDNVQTFPTNNNQTQTISQSNQTSKTLTVNVYFGKKNYLSDPTDTLCAHAVSRTVPYTTGVTQAALVELFKGPTVSEKKQGYYGCFFSTNVTVKSVKIENGIATVDFSKEYMEGCGGASSCSQAARNAIKNTLTQFPSIKNIQILIEGTPEGHDA
jgi:germination protein M